MRAQTKAILASVVVIALALTAVSGVTYSWWSDSESAEIDISTGGMDVAVTDMTVSESRTTMIDGTSSTETITHNDQDLSSPGFQTSITPPAGDRVTSVFTVSYKVTFTTTVEALYKIDFSVEGGDSWISGISVNDATGPFGDKLGVWQDITSTNSPMTLNITATFNADIDQSSYSNVTINTSNEIIQAGAITKWDGTTVTAITPKNNVYEVYNGAQLAWIAQQVNAGTNFNGKTFTMMKDIYLDKKNWTPIGDVTNSHYFAGTFDGQNNTIYDLSCEVYGNGGYETAGLFGAITGTVKNVNVKGASILSNHYAGAICGYSTANGSTIENCHVSDATITSKPNQLSSGAGYDNGDKVGGIIGYMVASDTVTGCSVKDTHITGFRNIGGIAGYVNNAGTDAVTGCTIDNVKLTQSSENAYVYSAIGSKVIGDLFGNDHNDDGSNTGEAEIEVSFNIKGVKQDTVNYFDPDRSVIEVGDADGLIFVVSNYDGILEKLKAHTTSESTVYLWAWSMKLIDDIDFKNTQMESIKFPYASLDGQNHTISNVNIIDNTNKTAGLFQTIGPVSNLTVSNISVKSSVNNAWVGSVAGYTSSAWTNVTVNVFDVKSTGTGAYTGGLLGNSYNSKTNCDVSSGTVSGGKNVGGFAGYICTEGGNITLTNCDVNSVTITASERTSTIGSFGGRINNVNGTITMTNCSATNVTGNNVPTDRIYGDIPNSSITINGTQYSKIESA